MTKESFLQKWHQIIFKKDYKLLYSILHEDIVFHTPLYLKPREGKDIVTAILASASSIFQDFKYVQELTTNNGLNYILVFEAKVEGDTVRGVDIIRIDKEGLIVEFEVMMRPIKTLAKFGNLQAEGIPKKIQELQLFNAKL